MLGIFLNVPCVIALPPFARPVFFETIVASPFFHRIGVGADLVVRVRLAPAVAHQALPPR